MSKIIRERENGTRSVSLLCDEPSMTKQADADSCDINKIMARYEKTGVLQHVALNPGFYADVSAVPDYQAALAIVESADSLFASLPASIRGRFDNDPAAYLAFVSDPANRDEMEKLGLLKPVEPKPVVPASAAEIGAAVAAAIVPK